MLKLTTAENIINSLNHNIEDIRHVSFEGRTIYLPLGTEHPLCRTGVSLLYREHFFIYLINKYISLSDICLTVYY